MVLLRKSVCFTSFAAEHLAWLAVLCAGFAVLSCADYAANDYSSAPITPVFAQPNQRPSINQGVETSQYAAPQDQTTHTAPALRPTIVRIDEYPTPPPPPAAENSYITPPAGTLEPTLPTTTLPQTPPNEEMAARQHLLDTATNVYETLETGASYPVVVNGGSSIQLKVMYPKGTDSTVSDASTMMCTDFPLYAFEAAGYGLAEAGLASRGVSEGRNLFESKANGDNILYTPQGGDTPPRIGDIVFMASHVAIISAVEGENITIVQFNARNYYPGTVRNDNGHYRMDPFFGQAISGWGFYFKK